MKDQENYQFEDFLLDDYFIEWVRFGKHQSYWKSFQNKNPSQIPVIRKAREVIINFSVAEKNLDPQYLALIKQKIDSNILVREQNLRKLSSTQVGRDRKGGWFFSKLVASFLLVLSLGYYIYQSGLPEETETPVVENEWITKNTADGQKLTIFLSDGSKVKLNAASQIRYQKYFQEGHRKIELMGEAFFEIARDTIRPFSVKSGSVTTTALGTSFNINTVKPGEKIEVALLTGKVAVKVNSKSQAPGHDIELEPGKAIEVDNSTLTYSVKNFKYEDLFGWKDGILKFNKCQQRDFFKALQKWYGVSFVFQNSDLADNWDYTGKFDNQNLENVLTSVSFVKDFTFEIKRDTIYVTFN